MVMATITESEEGAVGYEVKPCRIFVSDVHIGAGLGLDPEPGKHTWEWCTREDLARFVAFVRWVQTRDEVKELVLLGDMFDSWVFPHDIRPPTLAEMLRAEHAREAVEALEQLAGKIRVVYLPGNHDITMDPITLATVMPSVVFGGSGIEDAYFATGRLRGEHGHAHALFCSGDLSRDQGLPLGYFISRLAATADRETGGHGITRQQLLRDIVDMIEKDDLGKGVLDAICLRAGLNENDKIIMPNDMWGGMTISVKHVGQLYAGLFTRWERSHGLVAAMFAIPAEMNDLEACAMPMFARGGTNAVIMGHTHEAMAHEHVIPFIGRAAYVNAGCWANRKPRATWVEQMKIDDDKGKMIVLTVMGCTGVDGDGKLTEVHQDFEPVVAG
jgi:UDP-2,3-diacylglucosamine pyrophosphatase LpxH